MAADPYANFGERPKWYVHIADFANMLKAFIGSNYLSIAFAFHQSGLIPGIVGLVIIALLTDHCCHMIVKCKYKAIGNVVSLHKMNSDPVVTNNEEDITIENDFVIQLKKKMLRNLSYGDIGKISFGKWGLYIVNFCIFITQFGFCIAYFIFIGNTILALFPMEKCSVLNGTSICHGLKSAMESASTILQHEVYGIDSNSAHNDIPNSNNSVFMESSMMGFFSQTDDSDPQAETSQTGDNLLELNKNSTNMTIIGHYFIQSTAPSLKLLVLIPLPVFIGFSYVRNVRHLGAISVWANLSIFVGAVSVMAYLIIDFSINDSFKYVNWAELPMFFGLVTGAYEGIGTIIPIESSMEGNRHNYSAFLHGAIGVLSIILLAFGILGYLRFGESTSQMINTNIPANSAIALAVNICLCIGVVLTFPLQLFPVIEMAEILLFSDGSICGPKKNSPRTYDEGYNSEGSGDSNDQESLLPSTEVSTSHVPVATVISREVSTLKRNTLRMFIVGVAAGLAVLFRNKFAYIGAFTGSIGSSLLAYILPCMFYIKLTGDSMPWYLKAKNITIIVVGILCSVISLYASVRSLVGDNNST